jgi:HAE1 family hydrophobic/amphiphilic exporter-1
MSLTGLSINRPSFVVVLFSLITIFGLISYGSLSYELLPEFDVPALTVVTAYPGASPAEVESQVTKKVEDQLSSLENISLVRSTSYENMSVVILELNSGTDIDEALADAQQKLNTVGPLLPEQALTPTISKISTDDFPILRYSLSSGMSSNTEFYQFTKDQIVPELSSLEGVANVSLVGGEERAIRVYVDEEKLQANKLSLLMVSQAIAQNNLDFPTGKVEDSGNSLRVRLAGKYDSLEELEELVIARMPNGTTVYLRDVATIVDGKKDIQTINRVNAQASIGINVTKQGDANAVEVAALVKEKITELEAQYADQDLAMTLALDNTEFTIEAADAVKKDLVIAIFLVAFVILVFLHSLRDSFIVMLAIPSSFLGTLIAMYLLGYTFNLMTLLALTLVVGILVDDSIVVLENIHRHLKMGKNRRQAALDGRNEIGFTALSITFVDIVVFLPLALTDAGIISAILRQFSWVIVISTLLSLLVSFTVTPLLASRMSKTIDLNQNTWWSRINRWIEQQITGLSNWYAERLKWVLRHKTISLVTVFGLFVGSLLLVTNGFIGSTFVERGNRGEVVFYLETEKSSTLAYTDSVSQSVESTLMAMPEVETVLASVGVSGGGMEVGGLNSYKAELNVKLKAEAGIADDDFALKAKEAVGDIPGVKLTEALIDINGTAGTKSVQLVVSANDLDEAIQYGNEIKTLVQGVAGITNASMSLEGSIPEVVVNIDKEKMAAYGLNVSTVGATMNNAYAGNDDSKFSENGSEYDIVVQLNDFERRNPDDVKNISFVNQQGQLIRLDQFAEVTAGIGPSQLERTDRMTSVKVEAGLRGRQIGEVGPEIDAALAEAGIPDGVEVTWIGESTRQDDAFGAIGGAFGLSLILIYLLLVLLYNNYVYPLVVLFAIPMALMGAFLALALAQSSLSIFTMMGMVVMMGLVSKNSILIVDFANRAKAEGKSTYEALIEAGRDRLRPIMMTTISMVLGLVPVAIASGAGAEWKNGLGWTLIGGLTSSMILTIFVVPAVYMIVDMLKEKLGKRREEKVALPATA